MILRIILIVISYLLLAAHFSRHDNTSLMIFCLLIPFLLLIKKRWVLIVIQSFCYLGALVWIQTTYLLVLERINLEESWIRLLIILSFVAILTIVSGVLLNSAVIKRKYPVSKG
jgi:type VI protein secretion system component VasK